ncbi:MAG: fluoroquinolone transport system permease protein [Arcticibacterium sp.]|jgi:fluoroquinolone transport system permease protein
MKIFLTQLKWQFVLLQKNNIISISFAVTVIYGLVLYFFKDLGNLDKILITIVLMDPSVIGFFFIALTFYTEVKQDILPAIFISPLNTHVLLTSRILSLSLVGTLCSLGLAFSSVGFDFHVFEYTIGSFGICLIACLFGLILFPFASEFLKFALMSVPLFIVVFSLPILQYLGAMDAGFMKYVFPIQGSVDLLDYAISDNPISFAYAYFSITFFASILYFIGNRIFCQKMVKQ